VAEGLRILVAGMIAGNPGQGGATWAVLQYVVGLQRLGHEVTFVEPVQQLSSDTTAYFREVSGKFGLARRAALLGPGDETVGLALSELLRFARGCDLLLNISGLLRDDRLLEVIPTRVYLDLDPAFNQLWDMQGIDVGFAGHTHFATVGLAVGEPGCAVPTGGRKWIHTLPPVVLERWPVERDIIHDAFTTVGNWRSYGSVQWEGKHYGQRAHSLRPLFSLPTRTSERFLLALSIHPDEARDLEALRTHGWELADPAEVAATPDAYCDFVRGSKSEIGIAKSGYVVSRCGWFSDRSACYLASGRPVIAQETGFSRHVPTGAGLFSFATIDDVLSAVDEVNGNYDRQARAAREIAEEYFDSDVVLPRLLDQVA